MNGDCGRVDGAQRVFEGVGMEFIYLMREKGLERKLERNGEVAGNG